MSIINILHLSDLHFGVQDADIGSEDLALLHKRAIDGLSDTLRTIPEKYPDWRPDVIAITGDIAWAAKENDYEQAAEFVKKLLTMFDLTPEDVVLCPGNHDVDLKENRFSHPIQTQEDAEEFLSVAGIAHRSGPFKNFARFSESLGIPPLENSVKSDRTVHYLYGYRDIHGIRFAVLNTAWNVRKRKPKEGESLWIGSFLTNDILQQPKNPSNDLFVSLFHHPFGKLNDSECRFYGQKLVVKQNILEFSDVILNGHVHGEIRPATFEENKAHIFISSTAFDKDSAPKGCQIIHIDRSRRCYSTKVVRCNHEQKWKIEDLEPEEVPLDKTMAHSSPIPAETAVRLPPETIGWWLPKDWDPRGSKTIPIDDGASLCLLTFLLTRTDPYVVVLAGDAEVRMVDLLRAENRRLKEFAGDEGNTAYISRTWTAFRGGVSFKEQAGIVVSLSANEPLYLNQASDGYEDLRGQAADAAIVYYIWSDSLMTAAGAAQMFADKLRKQAPDVDVLTFSVSRGLYTYHSERAKEAVKRVEALNRNQSVSPAEEVDQLLRVRDEEPELWPYVLRCHAASREGKYRILSFSAACRRKPDMEEWFQAIKPAWFQKQELELSPFADLLFRDEVRRLVWGIYQKAHSEENEEMQIIWNEILRSQLAAAPSVMDFLSILNGHEADTDAVCSEDAAQWARNASQEEFQRFLPELFKQGLLAYWAALLASPYGRPYILREFSKSDKMQLILNAGGGTAGDPHWQELLSSLRQISRPCQ